MLDFSAREDGDAIDAPDVRRPSSARIGHALAPLDIVLVRTGRDAFYAELDYMARGPGVTAEATRWLYEQGVRVMGIDAWGWDRAAAPPGRRRRNERGEPGIFWAAHQADLPYSQIERLAQPRRAAAPRASASSCFPLRIVGAQRGAGARRRHPRRLSYRPCGHAASPRRRNLRARIAVSSVVSSPSTRTAIGRARPAHVVAILDG